AHHYLLLHGRYVCTALKPKCEACDLAKWCYMFSKNSKN
ncbi:MAG: endonuclease III, partial [Bacteroidales bacterium]|nr:endonuclease III [Bacteroidales bacterium]